MPWVRRDGGNVVAVFGRRQPQATEELPARHADILAFEAAQDAKRTPEARMRALILSDPFSKALVKLLAADRGVTPAQYVDLLVAQLQP